MINPKLDIRIDIGRSRSWKGIVWHHSASPDGMTRDWDGIVKYHTSYRVDFNIVTPQEFERLKAAGQGKVFQKPWRDVGYHGGTERVNGQGVFNWGRPLSMAGAHAGVEGVSNSFNEDCVGLCAVGDFDKAPPRPEHWDFNLRLTRAFMEAFNIAPDRVIGHREVFDRLGMPRQKSCPGNAWDMDAFRREL